MKNTSGFVKCLQLFPICMGAGARAYTTSEVKDMKEDEKKPLSWEAADPKPPVIHSGRMENKTRN